MLYFDDFITLIHKLKFFHIWDKCNTLLRKITFKNFIPRLNETMFNTHIKFLNSKEGDGWK